jgi:hypothetical protein
MDVAHLFDLEVARADKLPIPAFEQVELDEIAVVGYGDRMARSGYVEAGETSEAPVV